MKDKLTSSGALISSVIASICWIGPLLIALLGTASGGMGLVAGLAPYRTYFIAATAALLALSWALTIRRKLSFARAGNPHPLKIRWVEKKDIMLIIATAISIAALLFPYYSTVFRRFLV